MLSIALSGHQSGAANNIYHLPILSRLYDAPQFAGDVFVQSLRQYASGFWLLFRGVAPGAAGLALLLFLQILSRILFFGAALAMAAPLGLNTRREQLLFLLITALATPLQGTAPAGNGGIFIEAFTHSEVANATSLIALALAMRGRFGWAVAAGGLTFFINAFMAVWLGAPLVLLMALALRERRVSPRALGAQLAWGSAIAALLALPVLLNVAGNGAIRHMLPVDYRTFLMEFWPDHFLIWSVPRRELLKFAAILVVGLGAAWSLPRARRTVPIVILLGYLAVWTAGTVLPFLTGAPALLNLHLLRSSAMIVIVATLALAALAARLLLAEQPADRWFWGPGLLACVAIKASLLPLAAPLLFVRRFWAPPEVLRRPMIAWPVFALVAVAAGFTAIRSAREDADYRAHQADWVAVAAWAAAQTPAAAVFLLPAEQFNGRSPLPPPPPDQALVHKGSEVFASFAQRVSWVGYKEGAAVMWWPSYYPIWRSRLDAVLRLPNLDARVAYARRNGIAYLVDNCVPRAPVLPVHRVGPLCVYAVRPA